ncbi:VWA domain-containing protein [Sulfurimonas sp. SAG-AH-194-C20]|nr:VWA domain-containing protein [Sulfurimonas sp. SAG-AH-194-C20]MDF1878679.1 VWA domain-containing protein [Sulfurimonas sp. SAG-AH-194-C20]
MQVFSCQYPYALVVLFVFIAFELFFRTKVASFYIPSIITLLPSNKSNSVLNTVLKYSILTSFLLTLASPIFTQEIADKNRHTLDIVLSLDTSGSMSLNGFNELDYNQSRWSVVQDVASDFIRKRSDDRIGLVVFGDSSAVASPLSYDNSAPLSSIQNIRIGIIGRSTALIDSLATATTLLENSLSSSRLIILLSDGDDTASKTPLEIVLKLLYKHHIKVYTIAIGESNNNLLELISNKTNAKSFIANNKKDLHEVYKEISSLEASTHNRSTITVIEYLYFYPLALSLFLALALAYKSKEDEKI